MKYFMDRHWFNFNRKILNILSGDKDLYKKRYIKYKYILQFAKYLHRFLVADFCIPVFYALKMVIFVPRSARVKWPQKVGRINKNIIGKEFGIPPDSFLLTGILFCVSIRRNTHCSDCSYVRTLHQQ